MLGLPKATELSKPLPKKAIFEKFKPSPTDRKLFDDQINRLSIVAEISPQTIAIKASEDVSSVYVVQVTLKTAECDKKNISLLSKLIDQRMLFVLQYGDVAQLAVYHVDKVFFSERKPLDEWKLSISGLDLEALWENAIAQIGGIDLSSGADLDEIIAEKSRQEKLQKQIATLENKAMTERQPRKKWEIAEEIRRLKIELGGTPNEQC